MPVIPVRPDVLRNPTRLDLDEIGAAMLCPDDAALRARFRRAAGGAWADDQVERATENVPMAELDTEGMGALLAARRAISHAPPLHDIEDAVKLRLRRGAMAGIILRNFLASGHKLTTIKRGICDKWRVADSTMETLIWRPFRPVAHYFAARIERHLEFGGYEAFPCPLGDLAMFLGTAEAYRRAGEETRPKMGRQQSLDRVKTWRLPRDIEAQLPVFDILRPSDISKDT